MKKALGIKKGDVVLIVSLGLICVLLFALPLFSADKAAVAAVWHNGEKIQEIDLSTVNESYELTVGGCVLLVEEGSIRFSDADCPDKLCVRSGKLSKNGDTAACVPNKVVVVIENGEKSFDAVAE